MILKPANRKSIAASDMTWKQNYDKKSENYYGAVEIAAYFPYKINNGECVPTEDGYRESIKQTIVAAVNAFPTVYVCVNGVNDPAAVRFIHFIIQEVKEALCEEQRRLCRIVVQKMNGKGNKNVAQFTAASWFKTFGKRTIKYIIPIDDDTTLPINFSVKKNWKGYSAFAIPIIAQVTPSLGFFGSLLVNFQKLQYLKTDLIHMTSSKYGSGKYNEISLFCFFRMYQNKLRFLKSITVPNTKSNFLFFFFFFFFFHF